jgi:ABC-type enterochelin transport system substrate-binding protein
MPCSKKCVQYLLIEIFGIKTRFSEIFLVISFLSEFLKFVGPIGLRGQKIMRSANNVSNAGPHVRQTFLNDVFTFLTEVGSAGRIVNTGTSSINSEFVTALNT